MSFFVLLTRKTQKGQGQKRTKKDKKGQKRTKRDKKGQKRTKNGQKSVKYLTKPVFIVTLFNNLFNLI